jgi:hypothetical protein
MYAYTEVEGFMKLIYMLITRVRLTLEIIEYKQTSKEKPGQMTTLARLDHPPKISALEVVCMVSEVV